MKLRRKIPLAFATALVLTSASAFYGIHALNRSLDTYGTTVRQNVANERMVSATLVAFKLQVQEWKDTLLRGKDPRNSINTGARSSSASKPSTRSPPS
ncbi:hypothetical protein BMMON2_08080 [Burkholderia mallei]